MIKAGARLCQGVPPRHRGWTQCRCHQTGRMTTIRWRPIAGGCSGLPIACSAAAATRKTSCRTPISALPARRTSTIAEAFLVTVVTRLCLDRLKSARAQREVYVGPWLPGAGVRCRGPFGRCRDRTRRRSVVRADAGAGPAVAAGTRRLPAARRVRHAVFRDRRHARPHRGGLPATGRAGPPRGARRAPRAAGARRTVTPGCCSAFGEAAASGDVARARRAAARGCGRDHRRRRPQDRGAQSDHRRRQDRALLHRRRRQERRPRHPHRARR